MNSSNPHRFDPAVLDTIPGILFAFRPDGQLIFWNDRLREVTGYSDAEVRRMAPADFVPGEDVPLVERKIQEVLQRGGTAFSVRVQAKGGTTIPYRVTASLLEEGEGPLICGMGRPITDPGVYISELLRRSSAENKNYQQPLLGHEGTLESARENLRFALNRFGAQAGNGVAMDPVWIYLDAALRDLDAVIRELDAARREFPELGEPDLN